MYVKVGQVDNLPSFDPNVCWNPPGWGSAKVDPSQIDFFPSPKLAMVMMLKPGGYIPFHRDNPAEENGLSGSLERFHLVIQTNQHCWNFHDGTWQRLDVGGVYQMDPFKEHASINLGDTMRVHFVVDV